MTPSVPAQLGPGQRDLADVRTSTRSHGWTSVRPRWAIFARSPWRCRLPPTMLTRLLAPTLVALAAVAPAASASARAAVQSTDLVSRALDGGVPDGASVNPAISQDRRFARLIAFESDATNRVAGDTSGQRDVFVVQRDGSLGNNGSPWSVGPTALLSR